MSNENFENKLKKHLQKQSRKIKSFHVSERDISLVNDNRNVPINEFPPYPAEYEPSIKVGDIVSFIDCGLDDEEIENVGLVIDAHWYRIEKSVRFSKKKGDWVHKYACRPRVTIMWSDGRVSNMFMNLLVKKDAG